MPDSPHPPSHPLRILQSVRTFGYGGGIEHVAYELQRAWTQLGVDSRIMTTLQTDAAYGPQTDIVAPWISRIPVKGRIGYLGKVLAVPAFTLAAARALRRAAKGRMIVSHGDLLAGDICVIHAVNAASVAEKQRAGNRLWRLNPMHALVGWRDSYAIGGLRFRRYVAVSERVKTELQHHYKVPPGRIAVIPNGVNVERFHPEPAHRAAVRAEFGIPAEARLLVFAGHEFERKGLAYVVDALSHLPTDVHLLVAGNGSHAAYKARAVSAGVDPGRVVFAGARRDMPRIYAAADAFVLPTYYEAYALVGMEALACGVPLFSTFVGGPDEYLQEGVNGHFIKRDGADIAARIAPVLADPALHRRMSEAARASADAYAWPRIARQYVDLLTGLRANPGD